MEKIIEVPKVEVRVVEKIRHVPGPVEVIDVPQYLEVRLSTGQTIPAARSD